MQKSGELFFFFGPPPFWRLKASKLIHLIFLFWISLFGSNRKKEKATEARQVGSTGPSLSKNCRHFVSLDGRESNDESVPWLHCRWLTNEWWMRSSRTVSLEKFYRFFVCAHTVAVLAAFVLLDDLFQSKLSASIHNWKSFTDSVSAHTPYVLAAFVWLDDPFQSTSFHPSIVGKVLPILSLRIHQK